MTPALLKKVVKELSAKDGIVSTSLPTFYQSDTTGRVIKKEWDKKETSVKQHPRQWRKKEGSLRKEQDNNKKLPASNFPSVVYSFSPTLWIEIGQIAQVASLLFEATSGWKDFFSDRSCPRSNALAGLTAFKAVSQYSSHFREAWHFTFTTYALDSSSQADVHKPQQSSCWREKKWTSRLWSLLRALKAQERLCPLYKTKTRKGDAWRLL